MQSIFGDSNGHGFTNDPAVIEAVRAWREAAIADGWDAVAMYPTHETAMRATTLRREGFVAHVLARDGLRTPSKWKFDAKISIWAPDRLTLRGMPETYDWDSLQAAVRRCNVCNATDIDTYRYSFAGRCCAACLPAMRAKHERPGWCD